MNLQIRDPRARDLARRVAERDCISMTEAVVRALEAELARPRKKESMEETIDRIHAELVRKGSPGGRDLTKNDLDALWGHPPDELG